MESILRNVRDIDDADRHTLEHVLGQKLGEDQQVLIRVISLTSTEQSPADGSVLPAWCNVFDGLSDQQLAELDASILPRADLTRTA